MIWGALQTLNEDACEDLREDQEVMAEEEELQAEDDAIPGQCGRWEGDAHDYTGRDCCIDTVRYTDTRGTRIDAHSTNKQWASCS